MDFPIAEEAENAGFYRKDRRGAKNAEKENRRAAQRAAWIERNPGHKSSVVLSGLVSGIPLDSGAGPLGLTIDHIVLDVRRRPSPPPSRGAFACRVQAPATRVD